MKFHGLFSTLGLLFSTTTIASEHLIDFYDTPGYYSGGQEISVGDSIDPFSGGLRVVHTDAVLPTNGGLDISVVRYYQSLQDRKQFETIYGNWKTNNSYLGIGWNMHYGRVTMMSDAGCEKESVFLFESQSGAHHQMMWNEENQRFTSSSFWVADCKYETDGSNGYTFTIKSPSGIQYIADKNFATNYRNLNNKQTYVSKITDSNDNFILLKFGDGKLGPYVTEAESDDGTKIIFGYDEFDESQRLSHVEMLTESGTRKWFYEYQDTDTEAAKKKREELDRESFNGSFDSLVGEYTLPEMYFGNKVRQLQRVTLPTGKSWEFGYNTDKAAGLLSLKHIKHPEGASIDFIYDNVNFLKIDYLHPVHGSVSLSPLTPTNNTVVIEKKVTGRDLVESTWKYDYEPAAAEDIVTGAKNLDKTTITDPKGIKEEYYHYGITATPAGLLWKVGKLHHMVKLDDNGELMRTDYEYVSYKLSDRVFYSSLRPYLKEQPTAVGITSKVTVTQGADQYVTEYQLEKLTSDSEKTNYAHLSPYKVTSRYVTGSEETSTTYEYESKIKKYGLRTTKSTQVGLGDTVETVNIYDPKGNLQSTSSAGVTSTMTYHSDGTLKTAKNAKNQITTLSDYNFGIPQSEKFADGTSISRGVVAPGLVKWVKDARNIQTSYDYDDTGRLEKVTPALGNVVTIDYGDNTDHTITTTRDSAVKIDTMDALGRGIKTNYTGEEAIEIKTNFDELGRAYFVSLPNSTKGLTTTYDGLNRTLTECNDISCVKYDYLSGNQVKVTDGENNTVTNTYRTFGNPSGGQLIETTNDELITVTLEKNLLGQIEKVTSGNLVKTYVYDENKGHYLKSMHEPELGTVTFTTDILGNVEQREHNGQKVTFEYDTMNRVKKQTYSDDAGVVKFSYDLNGSPKEITRMYGNSDFLSSTYRYEYDDLNRIEKESKTIGSQTFDILYDFDDNGNLTEKTYPSGRKLNFTPDAYGRIKQIGEWVTNIQYDADFSVNSYTYGNGLSTALRKDAIGRIEHLSVTDVLNQKMTYDKTSNITTIVDGIANVSRQLEYDRANRLTKEYVSDSDFVEYTYDSLQNITSKKTELGTATYDYDGNNLLKSIKGTGVKSFTFSYDDLGRVTSDSHHSYSYLSDGTMSHLDNTVQSYSYDANNHRIAKADRLFVYDGANTLLGEYDLDGKVIKEYGYLGSTTFAQWDFKGGSSNRTTLFADSFEDTGAIAPPVIADIPRTTYFHNDITGTAIAATDESGEVLWREQRRAYGEIKVDPLTPRILDDFSVGYTGHQADKESGLTYAKARYYNKEIGRFYAPDPIPFRESDLTSINRYVYAGNNPYMYVDSTGEMSTGQTIDQWGMNASNEYSRAGAAITYALWDFFGYEKISLIADGQVEINKESVSEAALEIGASFVKGKAIAASVKAIAKPAKKLATKAYAKVKGWFKRGCTNSFEGTTLVPTPDGLKPIAELEEGDYVLSRDELTGDVTAKRITHKFINWHEGDVRELTIKTWLGDEELIITSDEHPFWAIGKGWVNAEGLRKSDQLVSLDNRILLVQSNTRIAESMVMYNFEIADYHTFAVTDEQVWVHNCGEGTTALPDSYWIKKKSPTQITPGAITTNNYNKASKAGGTYHQTTHYDKFGRQIGRTDRTTHNMPKEHPNPHHHRRDPVEGGSLKNSSGSKIWPGLFGSGK